MACSDVACAVSSGPKPSSAAELKFTETERIMKEQIAQSTKDRGVSEARIKKLEADMDAERKKVQDLLPEVGLDGNSVLMSQ
jgi:hypothetical protein